MEYSIYLIGYVDAAMKTCLNLREYEDVIDPSDIFALLGKCLLHVFTRIRMMIISTGCFCQINYKIVFSYYYFIIYNLENLICLFKKLILLSFTFK